MTRYVEKDCTIEHEGHKFTAGGAVVTPEFAVGYVGERNADGSRYMLDWHGKQLGTCYISATWQVRERGGYATHTMHQIYATIDGVTYTGRGQGEGMIWRGRKVQS